MALSKRIWALAWIALFVVFAALQVNDPDPWGWVAIYLLAASPWAMLLSGRQQRWFDMTTLLVLVFGMGIYWPGALTLPSQGAAADLFASMTPERPYIEEAREFLGLGIAACSVGWLVFRQASENVADS